MPSSTTHLLQQKPRAYVIRHHCPVALGLLRVWDLAGIDNTLLCLSRTRRLSALCQEWDGIIAAGVYMSVMTNDSSADGSTGGGRSANTDADADGENYRSADASTGSDTDGAAAADGSSAAANPSSTAAGSKSTVADDDYGQEEGEDALAGGGATATVARRLHGSGEFTGSSTVAGRWRTAGSSSNSGSQLRGSARGSGSRLMNAARWLLGNDMKHANAAADFVPDSAGPASDTIGGAGKKWKPEPTTIAEALQRLSEVHVEAEKNGKHLGFFIACSLEWRIGID